MIPRLRALVPLAGLFCFSLTPSLLHAEVEFNGLIALKDGTLFSLADSAAGIRSGWIGLQQEFAGFKLTAYDAKGDVLTLTRNGVKTELRLNAPKVQDAHLEVRGAMTLTAGEKIDVERATLVFDQENFFPLKNGVIVRITPGRTPEGNLIFSALFDRPQADGSVEHLAAPTVVVLPDKPFSIQIGDRAHPENNLGFSFTPTVTTSGAGPASTAPAEMSRGARPLMPATK